MQVRSLDHRHTAQIYNLLLQDIDSNLFLIDILLRRGIRGWGTERWMGVIDGKNLLSISVSFGRQEKGGRSRLFIGCGEPDACQLLGKKEHLAGGTRLIIGERNASDGLYKGMGSPDYRIFYDQRLYVCEQVPDGDSLKLHYGTMKHFEQIYNHSADMMKQDLLHDPRETDDDFHRAAIQHRLSNQKTLVGFNQGKICFLLDIGTYFNLGAQVGGTYVPTEFRRRGFARSGMRSSCLLLFNQCKKVN